MAKHQNPVRGYLRCPVCSTVSTVHQVGEGRLIETGEPPKNSRNLGLKYYACPECGNSPMSKRVHEFVSANMVEDKQALALPVNENAALEGELLTDDNRTLTESETVTETVKATVNESSDEASPDKVGNGKDTDEPPLPQKAPILTLKRVLIGVGILLFIGWMVSMLKPKAAPITETANDTQGGEHVG